ncbi:MAG TPA: hypothetical protein VNJ46_08075 [Gaiellaceae bacterium]|nr:hypothetical protein [Gaiellaceae bacterium]
MRIAVTGAYPTARAPPGEAGAVGRPCRYERSTKEVPVLVKIVLAAALGAALLALAQREDVLHEWGFVGSCEVVRSPIGDRAQWRACSEGLFSGYPSLVGESCTLESRGAGYEYWRCPAAASVRAP